MEYIIKDSDCGSKPSWGYLTDIIRIIDKYDGLNVGNFITEMTKTISDVHHHPDCAKRVFNIYFVIDPYDEDEYCPMTYNITDDVDKLLIEKKGYAKELSEICEEEYKWSNNKRTFCLWCDEDETWTLDEIEIETEDEDMNETVAMNLINITREFDRLYRNGEISNNDDADEMIIEFAKSETLYTTDFIIDQLKQKFPLEEKYDLVEVEVSRVRKVLEKAVIKVAVAKSFGEDSRREAEHYIENSFCEESSLDWEMEDDEYEFEDLVVGDSEISDTDILEELEACNYIDAKLE